MLLLRIANIGYRKGNVGLAPVSFWWTGTNFKLMDLLAPNLFLGTYGL
jgi:hypothetical protein